MPVQELEGQRGERAYYRRGLIFGRIRYMYRSVPGKHPLSGKRPCTTFQGAASMAHPFTYTSESV